MNKAPASPSPSSPPAEPVAGSPAPFTEFRTDTHLGLPTRVLRLGIRAYQAAFAGRPSPCRYIPSCSAYGVEALEVHGALRGSWLTFRRLLRCQPWGGHGHDPVPPPR